MGLWHEVEEAVPVEPEVEDATSGPRDVVREDPGMDVADLL
jgi:hypothetical protein